MRTAKRWLLVIATLMTPALALSAGGGGGGGGAGTTATAPANPQYARALAAIKAEQFSTAIPLLQAYLATSPNDADAENWLGYSYRKSGNLDAAFAHYDKALALDPKHRGVHEYVGEAYLMAGNLAKAEEHLKVLDQLCWLPCEEYSDLKKAITEYKAKPGVAAR